MNGDTAGSQVWLSPGVEIVAFGAGAVAFDLVTSTAHVLSAPAAWLCTGQGPEAVEELVTTVVAESGEQPGVVRARVEAAVATLQDFGLLGRSEPYSPPEPPREAGDPDRPGRHVGVTHAVGIHRMAFRSDDRGLVELIDSTLGDRSEAEATEFFDAHPSESGGVDLFAPDEWNFPSRDGLLVQLADVLNDHAARSHDVLVLHAGVVRTPDGRTIALAGHPGGGKSTLTAALIAAGCDYLGDESVALRADLVPWGYPKPLTLDANSRHVLGLGEGEFPHVAPEVIRAGVHRVDTVETPLDAVVVVAYRPDGPLEGERLGTEAALEELCAHTLNLARSGVEGLSALCGLASAVPVWRLAHPGVDVAVPWVLDPRRTPTRPVTT